MGLGLVKSLAQGISGFMVDYEVAEERLHRRQEKVVMALESETVLLDDDFD
jgi:uncharacterized protein YpmB